MTIRFSSLGFSSLTGKHGVDQAIAFKKHIRSLLKSVDGAWLVLSPDQETGRCEVKVAYDQGFPSAESWAVRAGEVSRELWEKTESKQVERVRG